MTRVARIVIPRCVHHITQRGNNRQDVFFVPDDYRVYLDILRRESERYGLDVLAYCLMTNHVHIVGVPDGRDSLAKAVGRTNWLYARYVNRLHGRSGHLWQNRFYSCALEGRYVDAAVAYVERNPARARIVRKAWLYEWSSAAAHCGKTETGTTPRQARRAVSLSNRSAGGGKAGLPPAERSGDVAVPVFRTAEPRDTSGLLDLAAWDRTHDAEEWRGVLTRREDPVIAGLMRTKTQHGRPLGSDSFLSKVEKLLGRRVRPQPVGRPKKAYRKRT